MSDVSDFAAQARREGWKIQNGFPSVMYDEQGVPRFPNLRALLEFIYKQAATSEAHYAVYLRLPWSEFDVELAIHEGWRLAHGVTIQSGDLLKFPTHALAAAFVQENSTNSLVRTKAATTIARRRLLLGI